MPARFINGLKSLFARLIAWLNRWLAPLLAFCVGIVLPYVILKVLTGEGGNVVKPASPARDTMLVKLVNAPVEATAREAAQTFTTPGRQNVPENNPEATPSLRPAGDSSRWTAKPVGELVPAALPAHDKGLQGFLLLLATYPTVTLLLLLIAILVLRRLFLYVLKTIDPVALKENDPDELRALFSSYGAQISALGTPRKIKRFSNKLRFQYYVLKQRTVHADFSDVLMQVLLAIEKEGVMYQIDSWKEFRDWLSKWFHDKEREDILKEIYVLNRGNVI